MATGGSLMGKADTTLVSAAFREGKSNVQKDLSDVYTKREEALSLVDGGSISGTVTASGAATFNSTLDVTGATALATTARMTAGTGITSATGELYKVSVVTIGNIIYTDILIDLTGLSSGTHADDIIGKADGTANCHMGQITAAINGTIFGGYVRCLEVPAGGGADINLWYADEATGTEDTQVSGLTNQIQVINGGSQTIGKDNPFADTVYPAADKYLYLTSGGTTNDIYTSGRLQISMVGYAA